MMENELKLEAPWDDVKELLKEVNYHPTDEDLDYEPGRPEELRRWIEGVSHNK